MKPQETWVGSPGSVLLGPKTEWMSCTNPEPAFIGHATFKTQEYAWDGAQLKDVRLAFMWNHKLSKDTVSHMFGQTMQLSYQYLWGAR
jgi:hypothetical protein